MASLGVLGSLISQLGQAPIPQYDPQAVALAQQRLQAGRTTNQTALLELAELQRQLGTQEAARQWYQEDPARLLGTPAGGTALGGLGPAQMPGAGPITQGPLPGMSGQTQTIPGYPDLSRYSGVSPESGGPLPADVGMPTVTPPQSALASLGPARHPLEGLARQNPDAARLVLAQQQAQETQRLTAQENLLKVRLTEAGAVGQLLQGANAGNWDVVKARVSEIAPRLGARLPQHYSQEAVQPYIDSAVSVLDKAKLDLQTLAHQAEGQRKVGLTPVWGTDAQGNPALIQLSSTGEAVSPQLPPGFKPQPGGVGKMDLGTTVAIYDRSGNIIGYQQKDIAGQKREEELGKQEGERPQLAKKAQDSLAQMDVKRGVLLGDAASGQEGDIDRAIRLANEGWFTTGRMGSIGKFFGHPSAVDLDSILTTIGGQVGFEELRDIKASGGTLGAVSDFENQQLQGILGSLKQEQSREQLVRNLTRLKTLLTQSRQRRQEAYQRDFGDLSPGKERPARPGQTSQGSSGAKVISRSALHAEAERRGISREQAEQQAQAKGYEVR